MKYRSRPVEVEAMQWEINNSASGEDGSQLSAKRIVAWVNASGGEARYECDASSGFIKEPRIAVRLVAMERAEPGWYVVKGDESSHDGKPYRQFTVCAPETFEKRWETAVEVSA